MLKKESLRDRSYSIIKKKIVSCEYPPGTFLTEQGLIEEVGTSRTPIREALTKLENEKLVRVVPKRGILVSNLSLGSINDIYEVRKLVEPYIIKTWGADIEPHRLAEYKTKLVEMKDNRSNEEKYQLDDQLHRFLSSCCTNAYLVQLLDRVYDQNSRIRIISGKLSRRLRDTQAEHLAIIEPLLEKRYAEASKAMARHLASSQKAAYESLH
jgi:Transcriptional regulators